MRPRQNDVCTEFDILMHELRRIEGCKATLAKVERLFDTMRGKRIYVRAGDFEWPYRLRMASRLLASGIGRTEAVRSLAATLEVSESTAYRIVAHALREPPQVRAQQQEMFR